MLKRILLLSSALLLASAASSARADTIFTLDQNFTACCGTVPAGTVTLHQNGTNDVTVTVQLANEYSFRTAPDANHVGLDFDLSGVSGTIAAANFMSGPQAQTFSFLGAGTYSAPPFGNFEYAVKCTTCSTGAPANPTQMLSFDLTGTGLTESSFVSNGNAYFALDVIGYLNCGKSCGTGNVGASNPGTVTPEPSSLVLFGTGVLGVAGLLRKRWVA